MATGLSTRPLDVGQEDVMDPPIDPLNVSELRDVTLWGEDHRRDLFEPGIPLDDADGVVALFNIGNDPDHPNHLHPIGGGRTRIDTRVLRTTFPQPLCAGEKFAEQPVSRAFCTGFLVAPDVIATAGHCVNGDDVPTTRVVFGFRMQDAATPQTFEIPDSQIYRGISLVGRAYDNDPGSPRYGEDWTLFRIDGPVLGHRILPIRRTGRIPDGREIHIIGHPSGLPAKFAGSARVYHNERDMYFTSNVDAFSVNSGSPVFNAVTHEVEGIVVRADRPDYILDGGCYRSRFCTEASCRGTEATRTTVFAELVERSDRLKIVVGERHTCALSNSGLVKCWGANQCGQLGTGNIAGRTRPTDTEHGNPLVQNIEQLGAGRYHTCARRRDGVVLCWGAISAQVYSVWDPLGPDRCQGEFDPHPTAVLAGAVDLVVTHTGACAKLADGTAKCWRNGTEGWRQWTTEPSLSNATWIELNGNQICAKGSDGVIRCGTSTLSSTLQDSVRLSTDARSGWCGVMSNGHVRCVGSDLFAPAQPLLEQFDDAVDLVLDSGANWRHCYLTLCDIGVFCRRCGDMVSDSGAVDDIKACLLQRDGRVRCGPIYEDFGHHEAYQQPPLVPGISGAKQLAASFDIPGHWVQGEVEQIPVDLGHACVLISDGNGMCWGVNSDGQLGNGTYTTSMTPVSVVW